MEVKSLRCESSVNSANSMDGREKIASEAGTDEAAMEDTHRSAVHALGINRHHFSRRHSYSRRGEEYRSRVEDRLKNLERKMSLMAQRRASLEKRIAYENDEWPINLNKRVKSLEKVQAELSHRILNVSDNVSWTRKMGESLGSRLIESLRALEEAVEANNSSTKQELARLGVNAARKAAELSLTREELNNLRRAVQALSVSASKLQERSDKQQEAIDRLNDNSSNANATGVADFAKFPPMIATKSASLLELEDRYHLITDKLPGNCEQQSGDESRDGLRLLEAGQRVPMLVYCRDGWTVVARRIDGTLDFDRSWDDYSIGFGSPVSEYWIGNEMLHKLTRDNCTRLRIDLLDIYGERWRAEYDRFAVGSQETGYRLHVDGYAGNATDAFSYQDGMAFSAKDRDMDASATHCAANYHGGWWFSRCQHANLNGKYSLGLTWFRSDTNQWMSIASSELSVRRNSDCRSR